MDENRTRLEQPQQDAPKKRSLWPLFFFPMALLYHELLLHAFDRTILFWDTPLVYILLFSAAGGFLLSALVDILPRKAAHIVTYALCVFWTVLTCIEYCCKSYFKSYWGLSFITQMTGNVVGNFFSTMLEIIFGRIVFILLSFLPLVLLIILRRRLLPGKTLSVRCRVMALAVFAVCQAVGSALCYTGEDRADYTYNYVTDYAVPRFGLAATIRLEAQYAIFGLPDAPVIQVDEPVPDEPVVYDYNKMELDFTATSDLVGGSTLENMRNYFSSKTASQQNEYTGMFKGKNLIQITAEAFSPYVISKELTPTLYKLTHTGIIFDNYYGTFQSVTTNGEYTMCMGLYPDMSRTKTDSSFNVAGTNYLPFCLGNALKEKGYQTWGYHDYIGDFYNRNITHANMGYTFKAADSGLDIKIDWPSSDLEMMEASVDDYLSSKEPFHAYYMTFSGHYQYNWDNAMSAKNHDAVKDLPYSEPVKAYIACNLELENALTYLLQRLEQAGVADKTCIVLTNDHYPYGLTEEEYNELAGQEMDLTFEKYRNSFICYVPDLSENIVVDEYCSTADILPTLLNLFGVDYDSRLLAGTDVLSNGIHIAVLSDKSFLAKTFRYNAGTETVIPADESIVISDEQLEAYRLYVDNKFQMSSNIVNSDYYAHVFGKASSGGTLEDTVVFTDITGIFNQASVLYMYRNGYIDPETPDTFGGKATATLGEFVDVLYRISQRPETDNTALPPDYETEEFNGSACPYYDAVCWAYQTGLLRQGDLHTAYDDDMDYQTACLLIYRYAAMSGIDTGVDQELLRQTMREEPRLSGEVVKAMLWCDERDITTRDSELGDLLAACNTRINRYQMTSFLFYLCTYELNLGS